MERKLTINSVKDVDLFKDIYAAYYNDNYQLKTKFFVDTRYNSALAGIENKIVSIVQMYYSAYQVLRSNIVLNKKQQIDHRSLVHRTAQINIKSFTRFTLAFSDSPIDESLMYISIILSMEKIAGQKILFFYSDSPYYSKRLWNKFCKFNNLNIKFFDDHMKLADDLLTIKPFILDNVTDVKAIKYLKPEQQNSEFMETVVNEYILSKI